MDIEKIETSDNKTTHLYFLYYLIDSLAVFCPTFAI